jgi:Icc-related predicted phosphoesterase
MEHSELRVLVVSDIHGEVSRVSDVVEWCVRHGHAADAVLCAGDIASMSPDDAGVVEQVAACEATMSTVLAALELASVRVYYVPGNHDSPHAFTAVAATRMAHNALNAHGRCIRIADGLVLAGLGGSTPAVQGDTTIDWSAFPYEDDAALSAALWKLGVASMGRRKAVAAVTTPAAAAATPLPPDVSFEPKVVSPEEVTAQDTVLMLCHQGPSLSGTSIDSVASPAIHSGSRSLSSAILGSSAPPMALFVHGHTHRSWGVCTVGTVPVFNPGSLRVRQGFSLPIPTRFSFGLTSLPFFCCSKGGSLWLAYARQTRRSAPLDRGLPRDPHPLRGRNC